MKRTMKQKALCLVLAIWAMASLAGCGGQTEQGAEQTVTCTIAIDCQSATDSGNQIAQQIAQDGVILPQTQMQVPQGSSVYDVLQTVAKEKNLVIVMSGDDASAYVVSIQSLGAGDAGASSGWMYLVNGEVAALSAGEQIVQQDDVIQWRYTCDGGPDIGITWE